MSDVNTHSIPCPICELSYAVVLMCTECWIRTDSARHLTDEQRAKVRVFERFAPMSEGHRSKFNELKRREGIKL